MLRDVYVITGGANGIGLAAAKELKEGIVVITDIDKNSLEAGKTQISSSGKEVHSFICDVTKMDQVEDLVNFSTKLGRIKGVVNSAGVSGMAGNARLVMNINLIGSKNIIKAFFPYITEGSSMILISSIAGHMLPPNPEYDNILKDCESPDFMDKISPFLKDDPNLAYNFSKRGVHLLVEKWATKFGEKGARINSISPGITETDMVREVREVSSDQISYLTSITALKRTAKPKEIATVIDFIQSDKASFVAGSDLVVDGGLIKNFILSQAVAK